MLHICAFDRQCWSDWFQVGVPFGVYWGRQPCPVHNRLRIPLLPQSPERKAAYLSRMNIKDR